MNELIETKTELQLSKELQEQTIKIVSCGKEISRNLLKIAYILNNVYEKELFTSDFDSMEEYVKTCFGLSKSSMYNLIRIGKQFVQVNASGQKYLSCLAGENGTEYTYSQIVAMLPLEYEEINTLCESGAINPNMTCRQIQDYVKHYKKVYQNEEPETDVTEEIDEKYIDASGYEEKEVIERDMIIAIYYDTETGEYDVDCYDEHYKNIRDDVQKIIDKIL